LNENRRGISEEKNPLKTASSSIFDDDHFVFHCKTNEPISKLSKSVTPVKASVQKGAKILDSATVEPGGLENSTACPAFAGTTIMHFLN
jgi:hypothetical protein